MAFLFSLFLYSFITFFLAIYLIPKYVEKYLQYFISGSDFFFPLHIGIGASEEHLPLIQ